MSFFGAPLPRAVDPPPHHALTSTLRGVLCDVYGTLLRIHPPPRDAEAQWRELWKRNFPREPHVSLQAVSLRCRRGVENDHERLHRQGIRHPEVDWASVMGRAVPGLGSLSESEQDDLIYAHMQLRRGVSLQPGAASFLTGCRDEGIRLGLVSNAQAYTLRELDTALSGSGLFLADFDPDLNFWSFVEGFSKPNPEVFCGLARRLAAGGIAAGEALMIGDRFDNDIVPAKEAGFVTWWLAKEGDGDWFALGRAFPPNR